MKENKILGYYPNGTPIYEIPRGYVTTAAFVICSEPDCNRPIRSNGGPIRDALCVSCYQIKKGEVKM